MLSLRRENTGLANASFKTRQKSVLTGVASGTIIL